jgi:hypothetical protein
MTRFTDSIPPRLTRVASVLLPLGVGILIGAVWFSANTNSSTAQTPPISMETPPLFADVAGERVTVVEARGGRDAAGSGGLIGFSHVDGEGTQVITIVDAEKLWMAVYHVSSDGKIRLVSSREIAADFTLQLNATTPLPDQIRRLQGITPRPE